MSYRCIVRSLWPQEHDADLSLHSMYDWTWDPLCFESGGVCQSEVYSGNFYTGKHVCIMKATL
jgi:hypothetical protein